jgi:hypothetical protein
MELSIAKEFSAYPSGRDENDGPFNGTSFRAKVLKPKLQEAIKNHQRLTVYLDGVLSFGSSFLEEAFGGLVRVEKISRKDVEEHLVIAEGWVGNLRYKEAIQRYISDAK